MDKVRDWWNGLEGSTQFNIHLAGFIVAFITIGIPLGVIVLIGIVAWTFFVLQLVGFG